MSGIQRRRRQRAFLRERDGDKCCWCGDVMEFPERGSTAKNIQNLATIERTYYGTMTTNVDDMKLCCLKCQR